MRVINTFCLGKRLNARFDNSKSIDSTTGEITPVVGPDSCTSPIDIGRTACVVKLTGNISIPEGSEAFAFLYDEDLNFISSGPVSKYVTVGSPSAKFRYVAFKITDYTFSGLVDDFFDMFFVANPHYKELSKKYKKESNEELFRISIDGKVAFYREDFDFINAGSVDDLFLLDIYQNANGSENLYAETTFLKTACTINYSGRSAEVKLTANDAYQTILSHYDDKYDLIKIKAPVTAYKFDKRAIYQTYIMGSNVVTNYSSTTSWDEEVDPVGSLPDMANKYHFSLGSAFQEVTINEPTANSPINAAYQAKQYDHIWNCTHTYEHDGTTETVTTSIVFVKTHNAGQQSPFSPGTQNWYTIGGRYIELVTPSGLLNKPIYRVDIYDEADGGGNRLYSSVASYAYDSSDGFLLSIDSAMRDAVGGLVMYADTDGNPGGLPAVFYLDKLVTSRVEMGRIVCDTSKVLTDDGRLIYPMQADDFASLGKNFHKVIPYAPVRYDNADDDTLIMSVTGSSYSDEPTAYGQNDAGKYFVAPDVYTDDMYHYAIPMSRTTWVNESHWLAFNEEKYETYISQLYKEVQHNDAYDLHSVIQSLLKAMGSDVTFSNTADYSRFFYGEQGVYIHGDVSRIVLDPKSNILTATYDEAAKKAEVSLKQVMSMLKQVYKVYWFVDDQNRLRLENMRYFANGGSYTPADEALDLTVPIDAHNKKSVIYFQSSVSYDTSEVVQRYEFAWGEDVTDSMGQGLKLDCKSRFAKDTSTEQVTVSGFNPDLDYMLFSPNEFGKDGFALLEVSKASNKVLVQERIINDGSQEINRVCYVNNGRASLCGTVNDYYRFDLPTSKFTLSCRIDQEETTFIVKQFKKQTVNVQMESDPDMYSAVETEVGVGRIETMSVDVNTRMVSITLNFTP